MRVTLDIPTLGARPGDTIDIDDQLAADLVAGGNARFADPPEPEVVLVPEVEPEPVKRRGKVDPEPEVAPEP